MFLYKHNYSILIIINLLYITLFMEKIQIILAYKILCKLVIYKKLKCAYVYKNVYNLYYYKINSFSLFLGKYIYFNNNLYICYPQVIHNMWI